MNDARESTLFSQLKKPEEISEELLSAIERLPPTARAVLLEVRIRADSFGKIDHSVYEAIAQKYAIDRPKVEKLWFRAMEYLLEQTKPKPKSEPEPERR